MLNLQTVRNIPRADRSTKRSLATASLLGTLTFVLLILILHFLAPEVDPFKQGISFYALTSNRMLIILALLIIGTSGVLLSLSMRYEQQPAARSFGLILLFIWGISSILAGLFPIDPIDAEPTTSGTIHNLAGLNFLLLVIAAFLIEIGRGRDITSGHKLSIWVWAKWLILVFAILLFVFNGPWVAVGIGGLIQRMYWLSVCGWLLVKALVIVRSQGTSTDQDNMAA